MLVGGLVAASSADLAKFHHRFKSHSTIIKQQREQKFSRRRDAPMSSRLDLWAEALKALEPETQSRLSELDTSLLKTPEGIQEIIGSTQQKEVDCRKKFRAFKIGKRKVELGACFRNIASWLNMFKEVGDTVVQYDPGHAALPWALFRFILQVSNILLNVINTAHIAEDILILVIGCDRSPG